MSDNYLGARPSRDIIDQNYIIAQIQANSLGIGVVTMQNGPVSPGNLRFGEGGSYNRLVYPDLAAWMDANGAISFGLTPTEIANGIFPDWRDYTPRTGGGSLGPAVGQKQEDAFQGFHIGTTSGKLGDYGLAVSGGSSQVGAIRTDVTQTATPVSNGVHGTPRMAAETRGKGVGVRWQIKAYGVFTNTGSVDMVALQNASAYALRTDVQALSATQIAQFKTNVGLKGTPEDIVDLDLTSALAYVSPDLSAYRRIIVDYSFQPSSASAFYLQFSSNGGSSWGAASHFQQTVYGQQTTAGASNNNSDNTAISLSTYNTVIVGGAGTFGRVELMDWNKPLWTKGLHDNGTQVTGSGALLVGRDLIGYSQNVALTTLRITTPSGSGITFNGNIRIRGVRG